jgi:hypothetical protein
MGPIGCAETSKPNCQSTLRNISEEHRCHLNSAGSPKSRRVHSSLNFQGNIVATIWNVLYRPGWHDHSCRGNVGAGDLKDDLQLGGVILRLKCDGTRAETRFRLSAKRTSPFKSAGASVQSTTGSRGVHFSGSNAGYTTFRGSAKSTGYPLHSPVSPSLPLPASPCAITF